MAENVEAEAEMESGVVVEAGITVAAVAKVTRRGRPRGRGGCSR
jgi:hypothetical protein